MQVSLRTVAEGDEALLLRTYASTREDELALTGWTEAQKREFVGMQFAAQSTHYARHYPSMSADVILVDGEPAGRLLVDRWEKEIRIVDIALLPRFRGLGAGSALLRRLMQEADGGGMRLSIHVERTNRALGLYRRLGFEPAGEAGIYLRMEREPAGAPAVR